MTTRGKQGAALLVAVVLGSLVWSGAVLLGDDTSPNEGNEVPGTDQTEGDGPGGPGGSGGSDGRGRGGGVGPGSDVGGGAVTLAFAGDIHFEGGLVDVPSRSGSTLGAMSRDLRTADFAMVNLESALTTGGSPTGKELEVATNRYWFRSPPAALDVLARSGVDAVSLANNHGADYGRAGLRDTIRAQADAPVAVLGVGRSAAEAFRPHRVSVRGTDIAVLAADASFRESDDAIWAVSPGSGAGLAAARGEARQLVAAVRRSAALDDVVVVYLHWGEEGTACATSDQRRLAQLLSEAGADVIVGSHAHVQLGAGLLGETYVSYGLGNFYWYHGIQSETGVLRLRVRDGEVVRDEWRPARIGPEGGAPDRLTGAERRAALQSWRALRSCSNLQSGPGVPQPASELDPQPEPEPARLAPYRFEIEPIGATLRARMTGTSYDPATCPVPLGDLRRITLSYVGYDGAAHTGRIVVATDVAADVAEAFGALYRARFPIRRMVLIDEYDGDDERSMAANNTSGYNCRTVAGSSSFSDHAFGRAIDINPVENPYVRGDLVQPAAGRRFVNIDRSPGTRVPEGAIARGDVVLRTFARIGWAWGGDFSDPDFQHFSTD